MERGLRDKTVGEARAEGLEAIVGVWTLST